MEREYVITIKNETSDGSSSAVAGSGSAGGSSKNGNSKLEKGKKALLGVVSYSTAKNFANNLVNYEISTIELRTGATEYEQQIRFNKQVADAGLGLLEGVAGGLVLTGGNPIGAVIGFTMSAINTLISYGQRQNTINIKQSLENASISMSARRAGISGGRTGSQM